MNEQIADPIKSILEKTLIESVEGIKKTGAELVDALYEQVPDVVNQLLLWHGIESLLLFLVALAVMTVPFWLYKIARAIYIKYEIKKKDDEFNFWFPTIITSVVGVLASIIIACETLNLTWLKIYIAPKVYLIEYLAQIVK